MEVARTSLVHAIAPHFMWTFAVRYAAHQLNLWPRVSQPEASPTLLWTCCGSGDSGGAGSVGAGSGGADSRGAVSGGAAGPRVGGVEGAAAGDSGGAGSGGAASGGAGGTGAGAGGARAGGVGAGGSEAVLPGSEGAGGTVDGAGGVDSGVGGAGAGGAAAEGVGRADASDVPGVGTGGASSGESSAISATPPLLLPPPDMSQTRLPPSSPLPAPPCYSPLTDSLTECWEAASRATSLVACPRRSRVHPPPVPSPHTMALRPSSVSQPVTAMEAEMAFWKSTGTYVDIVPPPGANVVSGMWIFRVKRPPGSSPAFKARYVACGFSQREGVDYFQTLPPTPKMTTLRVLLHVAAERDYELHLLEFSTAFLQGSLHEKILLSRLPGFTGSFTERN
ncbi:unnamed protein product [Closterium sp. NIES-54]